MSRRITAVLFASALTLGCAAEEAPVEPVAEETTAPHTMVATSPVTLSEGFATPEAVLHDADQDVYFVSNINGAPLDKDGNGFISRISADDHSIAAKWIEGGQKGVTLDAPKGMAIVGDELWVSDIDVIRRFDRRSGEPRGEIAIAGSSFLNDLAPAASGGVIVSDSGMKAGANGFEPSGTAAVWKVSADGTAEKLAGGDALNAPNGVLEADGGVWVVTFGSNEIYRLEKGEKSDLRTLPKGSLDGLVQTADGSLLTSSWEGKAVYRIGDDGNPVAVVENVDAPADIGYDAKRNMLLIPLFNENKVILHPLDASAEATPAHETTGTATGSV